MSRDKQIRNMAKSICDIQGHGLKCNECDTGCEYRMQAIALYNAGYRKASDVAREVIDEFERRLYSVTHRETSITGYAYSVVDIDEIAYEAEKLKKKYESEEK